MKPHTRIEDYIYKDGDNTYPERESKDDEQKIISYGDLLVNQ